MLARKLLDTIVKWIVYFVTILNVKTPFDAIEKCIEIKPEIFLQKPLEFKNKVLSLKIINTSYHKQACETWHKSGIYFYRITGSNIETVSGKIIKQ